MHASITENGYYIEFANAGASGASRIRGASYASKYNTETKETETLCLYKDGRVPSGLWGRIGALASPTLAVSFTNAPHIDADVTLEKVQAWIQTKTFPFEPRWYQIEAAYNAIKYKTSRCEVATRGGKTFILYLYILYITENYGHINALVITPLLMLCTQLAGDFAHYASMGAGEVACNEVCGGGRRNESAPVTVGTFQSLSKYPRAYFQKFGLVVCDESHKAAAASIYGNIMLKLDSAKCPRRYGVSGTQPPADTIEGLKVEANFGPVKFKISARELMDEKSIAEAEITVLAIEHRHAMSQSYYYSAEAQNSKTKLQYEKTLIYSCPERNALILAVARTYEGAQLFLAESVDYAEMLHAMFSESFPGRPVSLIHGKTKRGKRAEACASMEAEPGAILIGTFGTLSTGITIKNIRRLHLADFGKEEKKIRQSVGRGLCILPDKESLSVLCYRDIFKKTPEMPGPYMNTFQSHAIQRLAIYKNQGFKYTIKNIKL